MQSNNPVFTRAPGFNGRGTTTYGDTTYPGAGAAADGYGLPTTVERRMTIDSVVQRTGAVLVVLVLAAAATWIMTPSVVDESSMSTLYGLSLIGALGGFALAMVNSFKRVVSPALVLAYAVLEGVFVGAVSKVFETIFPGVVLGAVLGTVAAFAGTLAAYKFFNISVSDKFRRGVVAALFGFVAVSMLDLVLSFFHASFGFNGLGPLGLVSSLIGVGLGVLMLILDFDFVEKGVAAGLPEQESWRAAFALAVTLVWLYIEMLRILAILRGD